jgi:hypothetical protein
LISYSYKPNISPNPLFLLLLLLLLWILLIAVSAATTTITKQATYSIANAGALVLSPIQTTK